MELKSAYRNANKILVNKYQFKKNGDYFEGILEEFNKEKLLYRYKVAINTKPILLSRLPIVKEVEDKIPKISDYHINADGSFCFGYSITNEIIFADNIIDFNLFIEKNVKAFLAAAKHKELTGRWGAKEYSHNSKKAEVEEIFELFQLEKNDYIHLNTFLNVLFSKKGSCYCGSRKRYRNCHRKKNEKVLEHISKFNIKKILEEYLNNRN